MDPAKQFRDARAARIDGNPKNAALQRAASAFLHETIAAEYSYNFEWLSRPIIQYPQDMVAMQELIWAVRPDLIVETGIAHGGSVVFSASMLALLDYCDAAARGVTLDPKARGRRVIGVDIDIRAHNRAALEQHPLFHKMELIQGSSIADDVVARVREAARGYERVLVMLDSNHTHEHVLAELEAYAPLVTRGSYCCVFDTVIEDLPADQYPDRPWSKTANPKTAVAEYLRRLAGEGRTAADGAPLALELDARVENKVLVTVAPGGYLRRPA